MEPKNKKKILIALAILFVLIVLGIIIYFLLKSTARDYLLTNQPLEHETDFDFEKKCQAKGGAVYFYDSDKPDDVFSGTLLGCEQRVDYGKVPDIYFSELSDIQAKIKSGEYKPSNEKERLELYFKIVYPNSDPSKWSDMSLDKLVAYYLDMEFYYKLPPEIMPQTKIQIHRTADQRFYRTPAGVVLDQDPDRTGIVTPYVEVVRFGGSNNLYRDPQLFNGTYYYPVKGSGVYIPVGKTLIAYNKAHALKLLDTLNSDIVKVGGTDFQAFLQKDSAALWKDIKAKNPNADRKDYWVKTCAVDKHATKQSDKNCAPYLGAFTKTIYYIPQALDAIINEMVSGKSLRMAERKQPDGTKQLVKVYYGLGDSADKFLAQTAKDRGYDTLQFLREAEMSLKGDAVVGNELLHLYEPVYSQTFLARLDPFNRPYGITSNPVAQPRINYLLDPTVKPTIKTLISQGVFDPWDKKIDFNDIVPERN